MKNLILFLSFFLFYSNNFAQSKKAFSIGGEIGYSSQTSQPVNFISSDKSTVTQFSINPKFGYYLSENVEIGMGLSYSQSENEVKSESNPYTLKGNLFSINPFLRYYSYLVEDIGLFLELDLLYGVGKTEVIDIVGSIISNKNNIIKYDLNNYAIVLNPGVVFFLSDLISIDASIGFIQYQKIEYKQTGTSSNFPKNEDEIFKIGLYFNSITLGIRFNL